MIVHTCTEHWMLPLKNSFTHRQTKWANLGENNNFIEECFTIDNDEQKSGAYVKVADFERINARILFLAGKDLFKNLVTLKYVAALCS